MTLQKKDFIEIEFIAKTKDGNIFDSNIKEVLKDLNSDAKAQPFIFSLGQGMFLSAIDDFLIGKDLGKHTIELTPEQAFGKRDSKLIQIVPISTFKKQNINPYPGAMLNFDGRVGRIITSAGGRVTVDFNHPIAGKEVIYEINVLKKITDLNEQIKAFNDFIFRQEFNFEVKDNKIIFKVEEKIGKFIELFKDKFKELFNLEIEIQSEPKKEN